MLKNKSVVALFFTLQHFVTVFFTVDLQVDLATVLIDTFN